MRPALSFPKAKEGMLVTDGMKVEDIRLTADPSARTPVPVLSIGIVSMDPSGIITGVNSQGSAFFESFSGDPICGKSLEKVAPLEESGISETILKHLDSTCTFDAALQNLDGQRMHIQFQLSPVYDAAGGISSVQLIITPITKKHEAFDQQAPALNSEYSTTLRRITHDFNNILSGVLGYAELALLSLEENTEARESVQDCFEAALRAKTLVQEMIELNRKTFGKRP